MFFVLYTWYDLIYDMIWYLIWYDAGFFKKTAIHRKPQRYPAYPRNPQLQCCDRKCRASSTEMAAFFEGRQTQNSEDNIELGDGGAWPLWCGTSWDGCFFWRTRTQKRHHRMDPWLQTNARMMTTLCQRKHQDQFGRVFVCGCVCLLARAHMC